MVLVKLSHVLKEERKQTRHRFTNGTSGRIEAIC